MHPTRSIQARSPRRGFTIVELLVVVGIIAVLVGILLVAFGGANRSAKRSNAERFIATIGQAVEAFEREMGYLPPILAYDTTNRVPLGDPPTGTPNASMIVPESKWSGPGDLTSLRAELDNTRYGSEHSLAVYLLGTGDIDNSEVVGDTVGRNDASDDGVAGPGFRDPGADRSWGGGASRQLQRDNKTATKSGRTFGPFLDPATLSQNLELDGETGLFKILDPWGQPVRYYTGWPTTTRTSPPTPSVAHTPVELRTFAAVEFQIEDSNDEPDLNLERPVFNARFMLLSAGEPLLFSGNDKPIPLFGDRRRDSASVSNFSDLTGFPVVQNIANPFLPRSLPEEARRNLVDDLKSNVRYVP